MKRKNSKKDVTLYNIQKYLLRKCLMEMQKTVMSLFGDNAVQDLECKNIGMYKWLFQLQYGSTHISELVFSPTEENAKVEFWRMFIEKNKRRVIDL